MLDIQFIRDNPKEVALKSEQKGYKVDIDKLLELDKKRVEFTQELESVNQARNQLAQLLKSTKPTEEQIESGKSLRRHQQSLTKQLDDVLAEYEPLLWAVPNMPL